MKNIKTILLCGFLGAGKTTMLSKIVTDKAFEDKKIAVLVNDFGALPVDAALLPDGDYYVSKINKGSIFCLCTSADIIKQLEIIANDISPDYLLIEATGMAEPSDVSAMFRTDALKKRYGDGVAVCVVDAINCPKLMTILPAITSQLTIADIIIINKMDLVEEADVENLILDLRKINKYADIIKTEYAEVDFERILTKIHSMEPPEIGGSHSSLKIKSPADMIDFDFKSDKSISRIDFYDILNRYRNGIIRAKGVITFDEDKKFIDIVNGDIKVKVANFAILENRYKTEMTFILRDNIDTDKFIKEIEEVTNKGV